MTSLKRLNHRVDYEILCAVVERVYLGPLGLRSR
jgi:hypothetical protein